MDRRGFLRGAGACVLCAVGAGVIGRRTAPPHATSDLRAGERTSTAKLRAEAQPDGVFGVRTKQPLVGLTFDDGPDPDYTPTVQDILARFELKATFFLIGVNATANGSLIAAHLAAGHTIGNHTLDHAELELLTPEQVATEIDGGERALISAGVPRPHLFRPPKGFTDEVVGVFADAGRYRTIFWTECVERFVDRAPSVAEGVEAVLKRLRPGSIVLAHDGGRVAAPNRHVVDRTRTMEALPLLLDGIRKMGLRAVDIDTLLRSAEPNR